MYNLIEAEKPTVTEVKATVLDEEESDSDSETPLKALANSFLQRIVARANMFPYYDVVRWVIDNITITNRTFVSTVGTSFGSFRAEDIKAMYHLSNTQKVYNEDFIAYFTASNEVQSYPIKDWR